jgi:primosomal protein N' (replication factor Y)
MSKFFYNISLPLAVQGTFTYSSDIRLEIGFRVLVDFSNRERIGVVINKKGF